MFDWTSWLNFLTGIGLFLYGMKLIEQQLQRLASSKLNRFLSATTHTTFGAVMTGTAATALIQSSSLVGLIVLALASARILRLRQSIAVLLGANLGTTMTGWLAIVLGFKLNLGEFSAIIMGCSGLIIVFSQDRSALNSSVRLLFAFGLILFGLELIKTSTQLVSLQINLADFVDQPLFVFLLCGFALSAIIQSSSIVMIMTLSAIHAGVIGLEAAAALIIGADLGTTSTVILGSLKGATIKKQLALAHVVFNLITDLLAFFVLLPWLSLGAQTLGLVDPLYTLVAFHSVFNLIGIIVFIPLLPLFVRFIQRFFRQDDDDLEHRLNSIPVQVVPVALQSLYSETELFIHHVTQLNKQCLELHENFIDHYIELKKQEGLFITVARKVQQQALSEQQTDALNSVLLAIRDCVYSAKSIKDISDDLVDPAILEVLDGEHGEHVLSFIRRYLEAAEQLTVGADRSLHENFVTVWSSDLIHFHEVTHARMLRDWDSDGPPVHTLSTLLNINKELYTSCKYHLAALGHLQDCSEYQLSLSNLTRQESTSH